MNSVKLYSNGSAVITRGFRLEKGKPQKVTIPVKKDDLDDVVSSITVFGNVTLTEPPNYTPTNSNPTTLSFDANRVLKDLATKLRGSEAEIQRSNGTTVKGRIYGVQTYQQETNGSVFERFRVLLGTADGVKQFDEFEIANLKFTDAFVQSEIDKALTASFSAIKPDSRNVDLTIVPNDGADLAAVAYATPCAAWKTRYQLRLIKGVATLEGQAVVDNDTDDDWKDVTLSVITGEPISFSTDIAEIRRPSRSRVNVVSQTTTGAVSAEESIAASRTLGYAPGGAPVSKMRKLTTSLDYDDAELQPQSYGGFESAKSAVAFPCLDVAETTTAEVKESGDFSVYTSPNPVTVLSRKSAIIGLFTLPLDGAKSVLLYKPSKNERRPFTAIKFKNTTANSLNKGVCEVYVEGDRQGKCVLESTKQGEESFLVHAVETGVKVFKETTPIESRRIRVKISDNVAYCEQRSLQETSYRIQNAKAENFQFEIEHSRSWAGSKLEVFVDSGNQTSVDTPSGSRISTELAANGTLTVTVREILVQQQQFGINAYWLQSNLVSVNNPLARNKSITKVIELQQKVDSVQNSITEAEEEVETLTEEQTRIVGLIPSVHADQANLYKNEVADAETSLKELKKTKLPQLRKELKAAQEAVQVALSKLKTDWSDGDVKQDDDPQPSK